MHFNSAAKRSCVDRILSEGTEATYIFDAGTSIPQILSRSVVYI